MTKEEIKRAREENQERLKSAVANKISRATGEPFVYEFKFAKPQRAWRSDIAFPTVKVAIEIQGGNWLYGRHCNPASLPSEYEKQNGYCVRGWYCLYADWSMFATDSFAQQVIDTIKARQGETYGQAILQFI